MKILALESSTESCSVALSIDGQITQRFEAAAQQHARLLLPMADELIREAGLSIGQLDCLAYCHGPGSFTGIRIAAGMIQGIALGSDLPVVGVSSLRTLAHRVYRLHGHTHIMAAIDARMKEVYWGCYEATALGQCELLGTETVGAPESVLIPSEGEWTAAGSAWNVYAESLSKAAAEKLHRVIEGINPHAEDLIVLAAADYTVGKAQSAELVMPVYIRDKVAETEAERLKNRLAKQANKLHDQQARKE